LEFLVDALDPEIAGLAHVGIGREDLVVSHAGEPPWGWKNVWATVTRRGAFLLVKLPVKSEELRVKTITELNS
jgi:hypothetical protein